MTPCARSCCWSPYGCHHNRTCSCHWDERRPAGLAGTAGTHRDPTAMQAIRNVMKQEKR